MSFADEYLAETRAWARERGWDEERAVALLVFLLRLGYNRPRTYRRIVALVEAGKREEAAREVMRAATRAL